MRNDFNEVGLVNELEDWPQIEEKKEKWGRNPAVDGLIEEVKAHNEKYKERLVSPEETKFIFKELV